MNSVNTNLSTITSNASPNPYNQSNGQLVVDKVLGFTSLDENTCGYTWQESVYNPVTNEPTTKGEFYE